jgi:hypothetical protein
MYEAEMKKQCLPEVARVSRLKQNYRTPDTNKSNRHIDHVFLVLDAVNRISTQFHHSKMNPSPSFPEPPAINFFHLSLLF